MRSIRKPMGTTLIIGIRAACDDLRLMSNRSRMKLYGGGLLPPFCFALTPAGRRGRRPLQLATQAGRRGRCSLQHTAPVGRRGRRPLQRTAPVGRRGRRPLQHTAPAGRRGRCPIQLTTRSGRRGRRPLQLGFCLRLASLSYEKTS